MAVESHAQLLNKAVGLHQAGDIAKAIPVYERLLTKAPDHPHALNGLGLAYYQQGNLQKGVPLIEKALALKPDLGPAYFNLGLILQNLKRNDEAIRCFQKAATLIRNFPQVYMNLGASFHFAGRDQEALQCYQQVLKIDPRNAEAYYNIGVVLYKHRQFEPARAHYEKSIAFNPDFALVHSNLGNLLQDIDRHEDAVECYQRAIALKPDYPEAYMNLGNALQVLNRHEEAFNANAQAVAMDPNNAKAQLNLGAALQLLNRYDEAINCYAKALLMEPNVAGSHMNYATALQALNRHEEALVRLNRALTLDPDLAQAKWNKALLCLSLGRFNEGWALYDQRWPAKVRSLLQRRYSQPRWSGEYLDGTLLVWGEQGLGDQIIYSCMLPQIVGRAKKIITEVEPRLVPLFQRSFPNVEIVAITPELYQGHIDAHDPLVELGRFYRTKWEDFPRHNGYLVADAERAEALRERLAEDGKLVVGLSWASNNPKSWRAKTARLRDFEALLKLPGLKFVDLQYGDTSNELAAVERDIGVRIEHLDDIDNTSDIDGLAALIDACDIVVTVSNTTAHLAGALGKVTWVLLPRGNARLWYWFRDIDTSPWYPEIRLRRKPMDQAWRDMAGHLAKEIAAFRDRN